MSYPARHWDVKYFPLINPLKHNNISKLHTRILILIILFLKMIFKISVCVSNKTQLPHYNDQLVNDIQGNNPS